MRAFTLGANSFSLGLAEGIHHPCEDEKRSAQGAAISTLHSVQRRTWSDYAGARERTCLNSGAWLRACPAALPATGPTSPSWGTLRQERQLWLRCPHSSSPRLEPGADPPGCWSPGLARGSAWRQASWAAAGV